jgi:DNA-binding PadR family transcriptional regulator
MAQRNVSNPLALAVLTLLAERPMHPYEMASTLRERHKEQSVKLNYGSLYTVVETLQRGGLIAPRETVREGRRPERTVYEITDSGRDKMLGWVRELLVQPAKEYPRFMAGLTFAGILSPAEVVAALEERTRRLDEINRTERAKMAELTSGANGQRLPRLFLIEHEYELAVKEAELRWTRELIREIENRSLDGIDLWESFHRQLAQQREEGAERT